jgi:hypothetical protein
MGDAADGVTAPLLAGHAFHLAGRDTTEQLSVGGDWEELEMLA